MNWDSGLPVLSASRCALDRDEEPRSSGAGARVRSSVIPRTPIVVTRPRPPRSPRRLSGSHSTTFGIGGGTDSSKRTARHRTPQSRPIPHFHSPFVRVGNANRLPSLDGPADRSARGVRSIPGDGSRPNDSPKTPAGTAANAARIGIASITKTYDRAPGARFRLPSRMEDS